MGCALILLPACRTVENFLYNRGYTKVSDTEKKIAELETKHRTEVDAKVKDVQVKLEKTIETQDNQLQEGANKLYGANEAFKFYKNPERLDLIINNRVTEAQAAIGKSPTYKAVQEENERLKKELDEKLTSLEDLKKKHNQVVAENTQLSEATVKAKKEVDIAKAEWLKTEQKYISDYTALQGTLKEANEKIRQMEKAKSDNAAAIERMKTKLMIGCGIAAALCVLGTLYSPVGKGSLAIVASVFGGAAAAIPFIEGWMILVAAVLIASIITAMFLYKHHVADKTADNLVNHIQDMKENPNISDDVKKMLKESLTQWNSKYTDGKSTTTDSSVENYINSKLKNHGRL
jgi:ABC-type multidrug transport system fused ATPase/permease subunit